MFGSSKTASLPLIEKLVKKNRRVSDVVRDSDSVSCKYLDKDKDEIRLFISMIGRRHLSAFVAIGLPAGMYIGGLIAANSWNQTKDAYGTLAYTVAIEDKPLIIFESHLPLTSFNEQQFFSWFDDFVSHINPFETLSAQVIEEMPTDKRIAGRSIGSTIGQGVGRGVGNALGRRLVDSAFDLLTS